MRALLGKLRFTSSTEEWDLGNAPDEEDKVIESRYWPICIPAEGFVYRDIRAEYTGVWTKCLPVSAQAATYSAARLARARYRRFLYAHIHTLG